MHVVVLGRFDVLCLAYSDDSSFEWVPVGDTWVTECSCIETIDLSVVVDLASV